MPEPNLFEDFPAASKAEWKAKIEKDLRGRAYEELISHSPEGLNVEPIYTAEGQKLSEQPLKEHPKWDNVHEIVVHNETEANAEALNYLNRGATSLNFYLKGSEDLLKLLEGIGIEYICLNLITESQPERLAGQLNELIAKRELEEVEIEGSLNFDPLENLARAGNWFTNQEEDLESLKLGQAALQKGIKGIAVNTPHFANAGALLHQQLGISLAMAYEYIHQLELKNSRGFWFSFAVGSDYFGEIAKLRAFRKLWLQLQEELRLEAHSPRVYAETAQRNKTIAGRYNNLIRTTAEAMAAIIGGASEVCIKSFDHLYQDPAFFGQRLALNQLSILQHESHFHQVRDMGRGAYFIEELSERLSDKGWAFFKEIENQGGYLASLKSGWLQAQISEAAQQEQALFDQGEKVLIGANKFRDENDALKDWVIKAQFHQPIPGPTEVKPIPSIRLSEKLEQELLKD
jgi:methylmalonyl-CoA mutase